jgi:YidC/Oxa1 family membrane protein insertase
MLVTANVIANIFSPLISVFQSVLVFFHDHVGISWGFSIVLLTICVRAVLVPLTFRQIKSMVRMQALAPQMKEIQAKYKQDKERQSQEMMKFYRENNVNPLGSCLPLVLQLPVFISLYYMLRESLRTDICPQIQHTYQVKYAATHHITVAAAHGQTTPCGAGHGAGFLFIPDLTDKASGVVLVVLILLYVGSQLGSTLVMSSAATMDPMQRRLMMFLPLVFVLFVFRFPAGVLVYWITTNFWTMGQQYVVRKRVGPRVAVAGAGDIAGTAVAPNPKGPGPRSRPSATKALPKASADPGQGNGEKAASGGIGALFRGRGQPAEPAQKDVATNGASNGSSSKPDVKTGAKSDSGPRTGASARSRAARSSSGKSSTASGKGSAASGKGFSGSGKPTGSAKGSSSSSDAGSTGDSSSPADGAKPPPPPRKRKKRSGRRR